MKKALVAGASGGMGYALVCELVSRRCRGCRLFQRERKVGISFQEPFKCNHFSG